MLRASIAATKGSRLQGKGRERNVNIKEIVFPIDFSGRGVDACPYVAAVTDRLGARLTLLHVVESLPPGGSPLDRYYVEDEAELERRKELANRALRAFQRQYIPHVPADVCVLAGDPAHCIAAYGGEGDGRMIVMPTRGFGPFRQMLFGSVTAKVLHDSQCPVLTGPHLENAIHPNDWFKLRRIMCAVGLDWETDEVLKRSAELASRLGAELIAAHAIAPLEEGLLPLLDPSGPPLSIEFARGAMQDALERTGVSAEVHVAVGEVSRQVAHAAKALNADLIVIGKGGGPELPGGLGGHGYAIVRRAPCPVVRV
ncbi:MAG: universal stress protein [Bryobacteraceae bacterium]